MRHLLLIAAAFLISAFALIADGTWTAQAGSDAMSEPGAHLVLLLDAAEVRAHWLSTMRDEVRSRLRKARVGIGGIALVDNAVHVRIAKAEDADAVQRALTDIAPAVPSGILERFLSAIGWWAVNDVTVARHEGGSITVTPTEVGLERRMSSALESAVSI